MTEVIRGRLRVDARRAVGKLREYQLVDPLQYALELARAAVAAGSAALHLDADANDVFYRWVSASPIGEDQLENLFQALVAEDEAPPLYWLAVGVNAALALHPRMVEVSSVSEGQRITARFSARVESGRYHEELPPPELRRQPTDALLGQVEVRVQKRLDWAVVKRFFGAGDHPELVAMTPSLVNFPLELAGPRAPRARPPALLSVELEPHPRLGAHRAHLYLSHQPGPAALQFAERGVVMVERRLGLDGVRAVFDADRLPTNVSRSALRNGDALSAEAKTIVNAGIGRAVEALVSLLAGEALDRDAFSDVAVGPHADAVAFRQLAISLVQGRRSSELDPHPARSIDRLTQSLRLFDAFGERRALATFEYGALAAYWHVGDEPLPAELAPHLEGLAWKRGEPEEVLLGPREDAQPVVDRAIDAKQRMDAFRRHPAADAIAIPVGQPTLRRRRIRVKSGPYQGIEGEVALAPLRGKATSVAIYIERRLFTTRTITDPRLALPLDIAIAWPQKIIADPAFRDLEEDGHLEIALWHAVMAAVREVERWLRSSSSNDDTTADWTRRAQITAAQAPAMLSLPARFLDAALPDLDRRPAWPVHGGGSASLAEVRRAVEREGAVGYIAPGGSGTAPAARLVLALSEEGRRDLSFVLGPTAPLIDYTDFGACHYNPDDRLRFVHDAVGGGRALVFEDGPKAIAVAADSAAEFRLFHCGVSIATPGTMAMSRGLVIALDDDSLVVTTDTSPPRITAPPSFDVDRIETRFLALLMKAVSGDAHAQRRLSPPDERELEPWRPGDAERTFLWQRLASTRDTHAKVHRRLQATPSVQLWDGEAESAHWVTPAEWIESGAMSWLGEVPRYRLGQPVLILPTEAERAAVEAWTGAPLQRGDVDLRVRDELRKFEPELAAALEERGRDGVTWGTFTDHEGDRITVRLSFDEARSEHAIAMRDRTTGELVALHQAEPRGAIPPLIGEAALTAPQPGLPVKLSPMLVDRGLKAVVEALLDREDLPATLFDDERAPWRRALTAHRLRRRQVEVVLRRVESAPSVHGPPVRLAPLAQRREVLFARRRFSAWRGPAADGASTRLDRPVLYLPEDETYRLIVRHCLKLHHPLEHDPSLVDVTDEALALQRLRAPDRKRTRAVGSLHPALSFTMDTSLPVEGELELFAVGDPADSLVGGIACVDLKGQSLDLAGLEALPVRGRVQLFDRVAPHRLRAEIVRAVRRHAKQVGQLDLPAAVRRPILRALVVYLVSVDTRISRWLAREAVFDEIGGGTISFGHLRNENESRRVRFTTLEGPYPPQREGRTVVILRDDEVAALRKGRNPRLRLYSMDRKLTRERHADARREATPRATVALDPAARARCFTTLRIDDGSLIGELGLLHPGAIEEEPARLEILVGGRPLYAPSREHRWPLVGVVSSDTLRPNPYFDGPRSKREAQALLADLDAQLARHLRSMLEEPFAIHLEAVDDEHAVIGAFALSGDPRAEVNLYGDDGESRIELAFERATPQELTFSVRGRLWCAGPPTVTPWLRTAIEAAVGRARTERDEVRIGTERFAPVAPRIEARPVASAFVVAPSPPESDPEEPLVDTMVDRVLRRSSLPTDSAPISRPRGSDRRFLEGLLAGLGTPEDLAIGFSAHGRALRVERGKLVFNYRDPSMRVLRRLAPTSVEARTLLLAAITSELTRAFSTVTPAHERALLKSLLDVEHRPTPPSA